MGLLVAFAFILLAASGLIELRRLASARRAPGDTNRAADSQERRVDRRQIPGYTKLVLAILILHVAMAFILPLVRYAVTFSLADTAQGRHILFQTVPAVAMLVVWGIAVTTYQVVIFRSGAISMLRQLSYPLVLMPALFLLSWSMAVKIAM